MEFVHADRAAVARQVIGAADDHERERRRQPQRHHVRRDELAQPDAGVEPAGRQVDHFVARGDLQFDLGIGLAERSDDRLQDQRHDRPGNGKTQEPGRPTPQVPGGLAGGDEFVKGGRSAFEEALAGLGQADAAGGANEQRRPEPRFQRPHRLTDGRRRDAELPRRAAKTAAPGDAQERLHAVERALPDCEVLLHTSSTLSPIVAGGKRSYIWLANRASPLANPEIHDNGLEASKEPCNDRCP